MAELHRRRTLEEHPILIQGMSPNMIYDTDSILYTCFVLKTYCRIMREGLCVRESDSE